MITKIAHYLVFGKPLVFYTGIITFLAFLFTALIGYLNFNGKRTIQFKWHPWIAAASILFGIIHAILGLSIYFKL